MICHALVLLRALSFSITNLVPGRDAEGTSIDAFNHSRPSINLSLRVRIPKCATNLSLVRANLISAMQHPSKHFRVLGRKQGIYPALVGSKAKVLQKKQLVFSILDWIYIDTCILIPFPVAVMVMPRYVGVRNTRNGTAC